MSLKAFLKKKNSSAEAGVKMYWCCENHNCKDWVTTINDIPVPETEHNLQALSPHRAVKKSMTQLKDALQQVLKMLNKGLQDTLLAQI